MKTLEILKEVEETNIISEKNINLLNRRVNAGEKIDMSYTWDNDVELTPEQINKAKNWLVNQWKTPTGKERKNNPFGYREQEVIETLETIFFRGFYDASNFHHSWFVPLYVVSGKDSSFEYYLANREVNIIG